jgi:uncharacterized repeat protein (TIGR01451 family)
MRVVRSPLRAISARSQVVIVPTILALGAILLIGAVARVVLSPSEAIALQITNVDLSITKTDGAASAVPGTNTIYTITVSNAGPSDVTGAAVSDPMPAGSTTMSWMATGSSGGGAVSGPASGSGALATTVDLPVGGTVTFTATVAIDPAATGTLTNTATISPPAGVTDPSPGNNSATDSDTLIPQADLSISKDDGAASAVPGTSTTYTIVVANAGPSAVTDAPVTDFFPSAVTAVSWTGVATPGSSTSAASGTGDINTTVTLLMGGNVTFTAVAQISPAATGTLSNTATVTPPGVTDPNTGNNAATDSDTLLGPVDLAITKTDGVTTAAPGGTVTYTITVSNAGPSDVTGATVQDVFPADIASVTWTCAPTGPGVNCSGSGTGDINDTVNLPVGESAVYTVTATISLSATGVLSNTASVAPPVGITDPNPGNNSATDSDTLIPEADLAITKTDGLTTVAPGDPLTYTIVVSNPGPSNEPAATVADTIPVQLLNAAWTCAGSGGGNCAGSGAGNINDTAVLPAGGSVTYTVATTVDPAATGTITNTASVASSGISAAAIDPDNTNNAATDTTDIVTPTATAVASSTPEPSATSTPESPTSTPESPTSTPEPPTSTPISPTVTAEAGAGETPVTTLPGTGSGPTDTGRSTWLILAAVVLLTGLAAIGARRLARPERIR